MSDYPLVSIITATYKKFDKLYLTIDSVLEQDYPNIEYIITDDGSDEFPSHEIEEYLKENAGNNVKYRVIHHEQNLGTVKNLNHAYRSSGGEYIINASCGDVLFSNDVVRKIEERFVATGADVIVTSRMVYEGNLKAKYLLPHYEERRIIEKYDTGIKQYRAFIASGFYDMASGSAMSYSRRILERLNYFDEKYVLWEDGPFLSKFLQTGKLEYAYDIISIWYESEGVSSVGVADAHPQMKADIDYFNKNEKLKHTEKLSKVEKRRLAYINKRIRNKGKFRHAILCCCYLPEMAYFVHYTQKRKRSEKRDAAIIKSILDEKYGKEVHPK